MTDYKPGQLALKIGVGNWAWIMEITREGTLVISLVPSIVPFIYLYSITLLNFNSKWFYLYIAWHTFVAFKIQFRTSQGGILQELSEKASWRWQPYSSDMPT